MNSKIDKTFIVSLPERMTDRLIPLIDYFKGIGFDYFVWQAIKNNDGRLGLIKTIERLLEHCVEEEFSCVLICEDDCRFIQNPIEIINKCFEQVTENWDMIFLGCNLWQTHVYKYSENLIKLDDAYSLHSVMYSKSGIEKVLKAIKEMEDIIPLDVLIKEKIMPEGNCYCSFPILSTQAIGHSDIEGKIMDWSKVIQNRFEERTKHLL